jgi:hypothetical protein
MDMVSSFWSLVVGHWSLVIGHWSLVGGWWYFVRHREDANKVSGCGDPLLI